MRTLIFHELFVYCAGFAHPFQWEKFAIAHPQLRSNWGAQSFLRGIAQTPLRRPPAASLHGFELQVPALRGYLSIAQPTMS